MVLQTLSPIEHPEPDRGLVINLTDPYLPVRLDLARALISHGVPIGLEVLDVGADVGLFYGHGGHHIAEAVAALERAGYTVVTFPHHYTFPRPEEER